MCGQQLDGLRVGDVVEVQIDVVEYDQRSRVRRGASQQVSQLVEEAVSSSSGPRSIYDYDKEVEIAATDIRADVLERRMIDSLNAMYLMNVAVKPVFLSRT